MIRMIRKTPTRHDTIAVLLLGAICVLASAQAEAQTDDRHIPVYSSFAPIAGELGAAEKARIGQPFAGTGRLASEARTIERTEEEFRALAARTPVRAPVGIETIIGKDERVRWYTDTFPARAIALITFTSGGNNFRCSGALISKDTVLTAGHCVHDGTSFVTDVTVYPGNDGATAPFGSCGASWLSSVVGWTQNQDEEFDYGVIKLDCDVGNTVGFFGWFWQTAPLNCTPAIVSGYPGDKPSTLWASFDRARPTQSLRQIFYLADTIGGMSGSPVWYARPAGSQRCQDGPCIFAVHAYGLHDPGTHAKNNHGTRITEGVHTNLKAWVAAAK
jgi:glutamyl endopeptidase